MKSEYVGYTMRQAVPEDNDVLLDMVKSAPMPGRFRIYLERSPDFFTVPGLLDGETSVDIAEHPEHGVTGVQTTSLCDRFYKGQPVRIMHWGDLRVKGSRQGAKASHALSFLGKDRILESGADMAMMEMLEGNEKIRKIAVYLQSETEPANDIVSAGFYEVFQIVPMRQLRGPARGSTIRRARPEDLPPISALLNEFYKDYFAKPDFSVDWLQRLFKLDAGFGVQDIWLLERGDRLVACGGLWDQSGFRRTIVEEAPASRKALRYLYPLVRTPMGIPQIPQEDGAPILQMRACLLACVRGQERHLRDLLREQVRWTRLNTDSHFVQVAFHEREPAKRLLQGMITLKSRSEIFFYLPRSRKDQRPWTNEELAGTTPWTDFALC